MRDVTVVGIGEVCDMLKVNRATASKYARRPDFPEPVANLGRGRVWNRADIEAWGREQLPLPTGRPRRDSSGR